MIARLNRLFAADGKCFDVAVDHGFFGEASFLAGIEDMEATIATLVDAGPDAIQLSPGQAPLLQRVPGPSKPALVLRTDVANVYGPERAAAPFSELVEGRGRAGGAARRRVRRRQPAAPARRARALARSAFATSPRSAPRATGSGCR